MNYPYQIYSNDPTKIHVTIFTPDFKPAYGARVTVNNREVGRTDSNGVCIFDYRPGNDTSHILRANYDYMGQTYGVEKAFSTHGRTESFRADMLYVYTDRGVYNPGQDIFVRTIAWQLKGEYSPVPDAKIQLLFKDGESRIYSGEFLKTDEFGIASTRLKLPENMKEGDYKLEVLYMKARQETLIRVKRFTPPVIKITHTMKRYFTNIQNRFDLKAELAYTAGGRIGASELTLMVLDNTGKQVLARVFRSKISSYDVTLSKADISRMQKSLQPEREFKIKLAAEDAFKQKDEIEWNILYTKRPYVAVIEMDKDSYPEGETVQLVVKTIDIDKQPAGNISLILSVPEINLKKQAETDKKGVAVFNFTMPEKAVNAVITSPIMESPLAQRTVPFEVKKPMSSKVSEVPRSSGTKIRLKVNFSDEVIPVEKILHVDMTDISGALVIATTIPISEQQGRFVAQGDISSPTWGTMLVNIYGCGIKTGNRGKPLSVGNVGFLTEGQHVTFYADKNLEITFDNLKFQAAPGDKMKIGVSVKGGEGDKCLGVSVVDDAVISLLDPFLLSPAGHFYNPQGKTISTGGAGVLTWPVVDRNWGSPWRDIAYSNWGWKEPGSFVSFSEKRDSGGFFSMGEENAEMAPPAPDENKMSMAEKSTDGSNAPLDSLMTANGDREEGHGTTPEVSKLIIIRTEFPETAFWEPEIVTRNGKAEFTVTMPDSITSQKISVLATDKSGYIGLKRENIEVTQPIFIRSEIPNKILLGDRLVVRSLISNFSGKNVKATVKLISGDLNIHSTESISLSIPKDGQEVAEWRISGKQCGEAGYTVSVDSAGFSDAEQKKIMVLPAGNPDVQTLKGLAKAGSPFNGSFSINEAAEYKTIVLNVALPNVFPAIQAWSACKTHEWYTPWAVAASGIMNSALYQYFLTVQTPQGGTERLKAYISQAAQLLAGSQLSDGSWGYYPASLLPLMDQKQINDTGNVYYTAYCLRALCEIVRVDFMVDQNIMINAVKYLLGKRNISGLWSSKGAYFWDVTNDSTDYALSAEIFEVITLCYTLVPSINQFDHELIDLNNKMISLLDEGQEEPMTVSAAIQGIIYYAGIMNTGASIKSRVEGFIQNLIRLKRVGYWEPHWYHAYGSMVELNARILSLLAEYDRTKYASLLRECVTWLLSTREAWGAWHNEIGTANAVRALLKTGAFTKEKASKIGIKVNGKTVQTAAIDPSDPFLSSARLANLEITGFTGTGENSIEIDYNGNLEASVSLEIKQWGGGLNKNTNILTVQRNAPTKITVNQPADVTIRVKDVKRDGIVSFEEGVPSNAGIVIESLDELVQSRQIISYSLEGNKLVLTMILSGKNSAVSYRLKGLHPGSAYYPGLKILDPATGEVLSESGSSVFVVE
ncbi:MAG: hypothetical protein JW969_08485 [Spirochaetales bacterium]|nr:hypothetical protein [Spirochaetales bacterium]